MRHLLIIATALLLSGQCFAQLFSKEKILNNENFDKPWISWGFYLGMNNYDFEFDYEAGVEDDILVTPSGGFNVGLLSNLRINDYLDLRLEPGLIITQRELQYNESFFDPSTPPQPKDLVRDIKSTYVHFPLLLKVSTKRLNNFKPFIIGGLSTAVNLSSNEDNPNDNNSGEFRTKKIMSFYEMGFGIDFYFEWFKFSPSLRGVFAINDELIRDNEANSPWTGSISHMKTRGIFLNFTFQ